MPLIVNREQLQICTVTLQDVLELKRITMDDDRAAITAIGKQVLNLMLPQLEYIYKRPADVTADMALLRVEDGLRRYDEASFRATFSSIRISELVEVEDDEALGPLQTNQVDVLMGFTPEFQNLEPVDLIFGTEILVPMSRMAQIRKAT